MLFRKEGTTMPKRRGRDAAKEQQWRRLLEEWRRCGLTVRDFCATKAVSEASFYSWKREIARRDQQEAERREIPSRTARPGASALPAFVPVTLAPAPAAASLEVVLAGGRLLRVRGGFDSVVLRQLLAVLEAPSC
jgi:hypothetical protein